MSRKPRHGGPLGRPVRRPKGLTLVEVLIASTVLLVGFAGLITLFYFGYSDVDEAGRGTAAVATAESMLEFIRTQPTNPPSLRSVHLFDGVTTAGGGVCPDPPRAAGCAAWVARVLALPQGAGSVTVFPTTQVAFNRVTVIVSWVEPGKGRKTITLVTGI